MRGTTATKQEPVDFSLFDAFDSGGEGGSGPRSKDNGELMASLNVVAPLESPRLEGALPLGDIGGSTGGGEGLGTDASQFDFNGIMNMFPIDGGSS